MASRRNTQASETSQESAAQPDSRVRTPAHARTRAHAPARGLPPAADWRPLLELRPWDRNPRRNADAVLPVARSMLAFGFGAPLVARSDGTVVAGHTRRMASAVVALCLGELESVVRFLLTGSKAEPETTPETMQVPVRIGEWDDAAAAALAVADNRLGEIATWDDGGLAAVLADVGPSMSALAGYDERDYARLIASLGDPAPVVSGVRAALDDIHARIGAQRGGAWRIIGRTAHTLRCVDSTTVVLETPCDVIWTDPPYGVDYDGGAGSSGRMLKAHERKNAAKSHRPIANDMDPWEVIVAALRAMRLAEDGAAYVCSASGPDIVTMIQAMGRADLRLLEVLVWRKTSMPLSRQDYHSDWEPVLYASRSGKHRRMAGGRWYGTNGETAVREHAAPTDVPHPTPKPPDLIAGLLRNSAKPGDTVRDPFAGSGAVLLAADACGVHADLFELEPFYCSLIIERATLAGMTVEPA